MSNDPKSLGFNYGQPYATGHSLLFADLATELVDLRDQAKQASARAWELEMLLRDVRHATTAGEYSTANDALRAYAKAHDKSLGATGAGNVEGLRGAA